MPFQKNPPFLNSRSATYSLAPSTRHLYAGQTKYLDFCSTFPLTPFLLKETEDQLCTFVAHLMDEGVQHSSIGYLLAIRQLQIIHLILPYLGALGPGTARNSDMPVTQNTLHKILLNSNRIVTSCTALEVLWISIRIKLRKERVHFLLQQHARNRSTFGALLANPLPAGFIYQVKLWMANNTALFVNKCWWLTGSDRVSYLHYSVSKCLVKLH